MTLYFTDTNSFSWIDTNSFDWISDNANTMDVITDIPVIDSVTASLVIITPDNVLSASPVISSVSGGFPGDNTFTDVKSVIFDITDAYTSSAFDYVSLREIDFTYLGLSLNLVASDFTAYATSNRGSYFPVNAFDTSLPLTGSPDNAAWQAGFGTVTNVRLIVVFDTVQTFDNIKVNNYHNYGADTDLGAKNVLIYTSDNAVTNVNYNQDIFDYKLIFKGELDQHPATDTISDQWLSLSDPQLIMDVLSQAPDIDELTAGVMNVTSGIPVVDSIDMVPVFVTNDVVSRNPVVDDLDASWVFPIDVKLEMEIPISFQMTSGTGLDITLPTTSFSGTLNSGLVGDFDLNLPSISSIGYFGSYINSTIPKFSFSGELSKEELINVAWQFPRFSYSMDGRILSNGDFDLALKMLSMELNSLTGNSVTLTSSLPKLNFLTSIITGTIFDFNLTCPMFKTKLTSIITGENEIYMELKPFIMDSNFEGIVDYILRYDKTEVR